MNTIKSSGITLFVLLLLGSNFCMIVERLLVALPVANFQFMGTHHSDMAQDMTEGTVAISADRMNVFYIGVDNPITVAASGLAADNLTVSATGASISRKDKGQYIVRCAKPGISA